MLNLKNENSEHCKNNLLTKLINNERKNTNL